MADRLDGLLTQWRDEANWVEKRMGQPSLAHVTRTHIADVEKLLEDAGDEPLTIREAAQLSGYSADHLRRLILEGRIPNAGRPGAPKIARRHLPRKPMSRVAATGPDMEIDRTQIVRSAINTGFM